MHLCWDAVIQCFVLTDVVCSISDQEEEGNIEQDTDIVPSTDGEDHNTPDKDSSASSSRSSSDADSSDSEEEEEKLYQRAPRCGIAL